MRTTIDAAGRLVIPRVLRERTGLVGPAEVEIEVDGAAIRIQPVVGTGFVEDEDGILVIPATGMTVTHDLVLELRDADRR
jgi:bifunctional DNA-binding transcriptional regulator/antitoxin component of YhaV-PrlF toxin-antitoxin module